MDGAIAFMHAIIAPLDAISPAESARCAGTPQAAPILDAAPASADGAVVSGNAVIALGNEETPSVN